MTFYAARTRLHAERSVIAALVLGSPTIFSVCLRLWRIDVREHRLPHRILIPLAIATYTALPVSLLLPVTPRKWRVIGSAVVLRLPLPASAVSCLWRALGRGGARSQFLFVNDTRLPLDIVVLPGGRSLYSLLSLLFVFSSSFLGACSIFLFYPMCFCSMILGLSDIYEYYLDIMGSIYIIYYLTGYFIIFFDDNRLLLIT